MKITDKILKEIRLEYGNKKLERKDLEKEPILIFQDWFNDALLSKVKVDVLGLSTVTSSYVIPNFVGIIIHRHLPIH